jgi:serine/threonine protein kinase
LEDRIDEWREEMKKHHNKLSFFGPPGKSKKLLEQLLVDRLTVAYDLAAAFWYLHDHNLVYRDIKPANIGFDHRGMYSPLIISPFVCIMGKLIDLSHCYKQGTSKYLTLGCAKICHPH